MVTIVR